MKTEANVPASPFEFKYKEAWNSPVILSQYGGLTKREYFAAQAMAGFITAGRIRRMTLWSRILMYLGSTKWVATNMYNNKENAESAVEMADELIKALNNE